MVALLHSVNITAEAKTTAHLTKLMLALTSRTQQMFNAQTVNPSEQTKIAVSKDYKIKVYTPILECILLLHNYLHIDAILIIFDDKLSSTEVSALKSFDIPFFKARIVYKHSFAFFISSLY